MSDELMELPEGWKNTTLGELGEWSSGGTPSRKEARYYGGEIPWLKTGDLPDGLITEIEETITQQGLNNSSAKIFPENSLVVAMYGATIGKLGILSEPAATNQACAVLCSQGITSSLIPFLFYYLLNIREDLRMIGQGGAQPNISQTILKNYPCFLPPLNEQKRIVTQIEALRERSQKAKAALEAIPELCDRFRQSVLAAAFRGDLTADWREENPDIEWEESLLGKVIKDKPRNGYSPKPVDYPTKVKSLTLSATTSGTFKAEFFKYLDEEIEPTSHLWLNPGDILIQRSNTLEYVGTCAIYTGNSKEFIYPDLMMKIRVVKVKPEFIHYLLSSKATKDYFKNNATGTAGNMPKINQQIVMNAPVIIPHIEEQEQIVSYIQRCFQTIDQIEQQYKTLQIQLNRFNQSILAKAFRGELVEQDPNDEPASVLLERIRAEREAQQLAKKPRGKGTGRKKTE